MTQYIVKEGRATPLITQTWSQAVTLADPHSSFRVSIQIKLPFFFFPFSFRLHAGFVGLFAKKKFKLLGMAG